MTARADNEKRKGGAAWSRVVRAALACVLAVGMVPAAALATEADEGIAKNEASLLAVADETAWAQGTITAVTDAEGNAVSDLSDITFVYTGEPHYVVPTEVTPAESGALEVIDNEWPYAFYYYELNSQGIWQTIAKEHITNVGTYAVTVGNADLNSAETQRLEFSIVSASLEGATLYEINSDDSSDTSDADFVWDNTEWVVGSKLGVVVDGAIVDPANYTVDYYQNNLEASAPTNIGSYTVLITGKNNYAGSSATIDFEIKALDLSTAVFDVTMTDWGQLPTSITANGVLVYGGATDYVEVKADQMMTGDPGIYTFTVTADDPNLSGSGTATAIKVGTEVFYDDNTVNGNFEFTYDGVAWETLLTRGAPGQWSQLGNDLTYTVDRDESSHYDFDATLLALKANGGAAIAFDVVVTDDTGNAASTSDLTTVGTWTVRVVVDAAASNYEYGGSLTFTVEVLAADVYADEGVFVRYNGALVSDIAVTYDGSNLIDDIDISVVYGGTLTLTENTDYTVTYLDANGTEVSEIVNAGTYTIVIEGVLDYVIRGNGDDQEIIFVTVSPIQITGIRIDPSTLTYYNADYPDGAYLYNAELDITPVYQYTAASDPSSAEAEWFELPEGAVTATYHYWTGSAFEQVDAINAPGTYQIEFKDAVGSFAVSVNYAFDGTLTTTAIVDDTMLFADVDYDEWYTDYVYLAASEGYMTGYAGTTTFGPHNNLLRGEASTVLFRMAGGSDESSSSLERSGSDVFPDVEAGAYYDTPIGWAYQTGIVTGYLDGSGEFRPDNSITREEFCVMLYRYAKATDQIGDKTSADLVSYPDADEISDFAQEAVEWAVANGIFGGDVVLRPGDSISRAEVAKMVIVLQPETLTTIF